MHGTICKSRVGAYSLPDKFDGTRLKGCARALFVLLTGIVIMGSLVSSTRSGIAQTSMGKQAQCELAAIRDTRSALAIQVIRSSCNWLALNGESLLNESNRNYYYCLVQQLSGVQADRAAEAIVSACRRAYMP
jgi:hypothetical protein